MSRIPLPDISSRAWEHPADRGALVALRKLRGFDVMMRKISGFLSERAIRINLMGSAVRCDSQQFSRVYFRLLEVAAGLDCRELPEIYVVNSPVMNAMTIGIDKPVIVVNSALVHALDDDELRFVIGHELGHAMSGHALYRTMLTVIVTMMNQFASVPFSGIAFRAIMAGLLEWSRKAELSADRAGLLATQDEDATIRALMKLAGDGGHGDLNKDAFLAQAREYAAMDGARDVVLRTLVTLNQTHPYVVARAAELVTWIDSGGYQTVLAGSYPRRSEDASARVTDEAAAAATSYSNDFAQVEDFFGSLGKHLGDAAGEMGTLLSDFFSSKK